VPLYEKTSMHLHSAGNLTAAQATGANVDMLRCPVHYGLDAFHVGLPCTVGTSVGMADSDAESDILTAIFTLCHL
jgi:hypothetical protein